MSAAVVVDERPSGDARPSPPRAHRWREFGPLLFTALNALAFLLVRPDVNDLWAARARASAVSHGVGLSYWFTWFSGSTPGNYSVFTPSLCALIGTETVGALSAVAIVALTTVLVRRTSHPLAAAAFAAVATVANLWSGRIPFLLGAAIGVGALLAVRGHHRTRTVVLTALSVLASPVTGAFLILGLSGTFLTTRTRAYRPVIAWSVGTALVGLLLVALFFGAPGNEPFELVYALEVLGALVLLRLLSPPDHLRTTIYVTALATIALFLVPNGMGSNIARLALFCLPVAVVAASPLRARLLAAAVVPIAVAGCAGTVLDLVNAEQPVSSAGYYAPLAAELDSLSGLNNCRVELVDHGAHAGYYALLNHVLLARGWETQTDNELNHALTVNDLDAVTYKVWLDNNAVCYVALPSDSVTSNPEYDLVAKGGIGYLSPVWRDANWRLFRVEHSTPIVAAPAAVLGRSQASMRIRIPCACTINVRVRWSQYLDARLEAPATAGASPAVDAPVTDDRAGWTRITSPRPGTYVLSGHLGGFLR